MPAKGAPAPESIQLILVRTLCEDIANRRYTLTAFARASVEIDGGRSSMQNRRRQFRRLMRAWATFGATTGLKLRVGSALNLAYTIEKLGGTIPYRVRRWVALIRAPEPYAKRRLPAGHRKASRELLQLFLDEVFCPPGEGTQPQTGRVSWAQDDQLDEEVDDAEDPELQELLAELARKLQQSDDRRAELSSTLVRRQQYSYQKATAALISTGRLTKGSLARLLERRDTKPAVSKPIRKR